MRKGWTETTVGEIMTIQRTRAQPSSLDASAVYVGLEHLETGRPTLRATGQIGTTTSSATPFLQDDVLFGKLRPYLRKVVIAEFAGFSTTELLVMRSTSLVLPHFLLYLTTQPDVFSFCEAVSAGTRMPRVSTKDISGITVALPPLVEQRRIVDVIESVDTYINALETRASTARAARAALLHELLSAGGEGWTETTLGEVTAINSEATSGWHSGREFSYVDIGCVSESAGIDLAATKVFTVAEAPGRARRVIRENDVIVSTVRPYLRGFARVPSELEGNVASTGFTVLRSTITKSVPGFVWATVRTQCFVDYLISRSTGSTYPAVRSKDIAGFPISLPPIAEQRRIVDVIESVDAGIAAADAAAADARDLRSALLSDLLSGDHEIPDSYDRFLGAT